MSLRWRVGLGALLLVLAGVAAASAEPRQARPMAQDPALEARLLLISEELRCLVCQNESLASSNAELAQDLRNEVRDLMRQGKSDVEVKQFLVQRYGDFVLYRPEFKPLTYLLWVGPFVLLVLGLLVLWRVLRLRRQAAVSTQLSPEERRKAEQLLKDAS